MSKIDSSKCNFFFRMNDVLLTIIVYKTMYTKNYVIFIKQVLYIIFLSINLYIIATKKIFYFKKCNRC